MLRAELVDVELFAGPQKLSDHLERRRRRALDQLNELPAEELLADPAGWAGRLSNDNSPQPLKLLFDERSRGKPGEGDDGQMRVTIFIPFRGDAELFEMHANRMSVHGHPRASLVLGDEDPRVAIRVVGPELTDEMVNGRAAEFHHQLEGFVDWTNTLCAKAADELREEMRRAATDRAERIAKLNDLNKQLTIPLGRSSAAPLPVPVHARRIVPATRDRAAGHRDWRMAEDVYELVVDTLIRFGAAIGRQPGTLANFKEEDIRNLALVVLNSNYEMAGARGEVFNGIGKADIVVPWADGNAFVGEFKIWRGRAGVTAGISQLMRRYITWQDTKAAFVLVVKTSLATRAIESAIAAVMTHPLTVRELDTDDPDRRRNYLLRSAVDPDRLVRLAFLPIVVRRPQSEPQDLPDLRRA